jgi:hypothetical protein
VSALVVALLLAQAPVPKATVVDVSAPDAIYEDISRGYATDVVKALEKAGFEARRIDESELPVDGCHSGPCLARVAKDNKADVVITLDATELDKKTNGVAVAAMWGLNGEPLTVTRYTLKPNAKPPKELATFATNVLAALKKKQPPPPRDAGT